MSNSPFDVVVDPPVTKVDHAVPATGTTAVPFATVDATNPWLGLVSFTEATRDFFHGRNEEVAELGRRVQRKLLTILFGQSGLGKTSILQAGLVPRLRPEGFCPIYVRLDYAVGALPPAEQIKLAVVRATDSVGTWSRTSALPEGESLWEFFHHRGEVLTSHTGQVLTPLLIFDQFEEIFTLAQSDDAGRQRAQTFIADLADLVENRPPASLEDRIDREELDAALYDFARADYRILISLREDYLAHLEGLKAQMPSVTQNRMRLARMTGVQAVEAVRSPAPQLVSEAVAEAVVRFVAGGTELARAEVESSLLSLICRELNNTRLTRGHPEISADLLAGSRDSILAEYYQRALADQPAGVRIFIEDEMLTDSGFRESVAEERVRKGFIAAGAVTGALALLVDRRLLRVEDRLDLRRVEITHDVLCSVISTSRNVRREHEALEESQRQLALQQEREKVTHRSLRRAQLIATVCSVLLLLAAANAVFGYINLRRARSAETLAERARGEAEKLVGFLMEDFYTELEPTGRLETMGKLAHMAVAYYDGLPPELLTAGTQVYRGMALAREGATMQARGDMTGGMKTLAEAKAVFEQLRSNGDQSEEAAVGLALTLYASSNGSGVLRPVRLQQAAALLQPRAEGPGSARRVRLLYAEVLNQLSHTQENETAIATCEEARKILLALGALELTDLTATSVYGDTSDSEARHALALGRLDDAEKLQREVLDLAEKVLVKRPGDLKAMVNRCYSPLMLATISARRFDSASALLFANKADQAAADYVRFNPTTALGWQMLSQCRESIMNALLAQGKVADALVQARAAAALDQDPRNASGINPQALNFWSVIAGYEAQLGHRPAAEEAVQEGRKVAERWTKQGQLGVGLVKLVPEWNGITESEVHLAFGEYAEAYIDSLASLNRLKNLPDIDPHFAATKGNAYRRAAVNTIMAALRQGQGAEAESVARALLDDPLKGVELDRVNVVADWHRVLLAHALVLQGRQAEVAPVLTPALTRYRDQQSKMLTGVGFLQRVARAFTGSGAPVNKAAASAEFLYRSAYASYIHALTQPDTDEGTQAKRTALEDATKSLQGIPEECKQLRDWKDLNDLLFKARIRPGKKSV
jgi:tetratricopeptide (TPR) repeat protein